MCSCGEKYDLQHTKADFVSLRYNNLRNITSVLIDQVCHDVRVAPPSSNFDRRDIWRQIMWVMKSSWTLVRDGFGPNTK